VLIEKFLEYIRVEKRYSSHTVTSYGKDLRDFLEFLLQTENTYDTLCVDKKIVRNFIIFLRKKNISNRSINRKISCLRGYYLFLMKIGELRISPVECIYSLKFHPEKQIPMSEEEMLNLRKVFAEKPDVLSETIIETLYQTGMRRVELCNIEYKDVDFSSNHIKILGKGNKYRNVPISPDLRSLLVGYISYRKPLKEFQHLFFVNKKGRKLSEKFVYLKVNEYLGYVSSKKKKSPHILRHSFATHILDNGGEIFAVKEILGHSSLVSTQVYTDASIEKLKKIVNLAHPRATKKREL